MTAVVEIESLTKDFKVGFLKKRTVRALDDLTLRVESGQIFGFLGPNGAGKTTTLKLLMGLLHPTSGTARILGEPITSISMHRRIGYLPEQAYFYDYLTARELLEYYGHLAGVADASLRQRADELLDKVGLARAAFDRQLRKFSKGMLQRVGLAQALIHDPEVIFLDEPMSGLDPIGRRQVRDLIMELRDRGKTVFFSSHILSDVEALCDRVAILNEGRLVESGSLSEIVLRRAGELEIVVTNIADEQLGVFESEGWTVTSTPGGFHITVPDESAVDRALERIREFGGYLIAVNRTRSSLEDFFMAEFAPEHTDAEAVESETV